MRTLPAALATAAMTLGSQPDLKLDLADIWPHFSTVVLPGNSGPCAVAIAPDGSLIAAYVAQGAGQRLRAAGDQPGQRGELGRLRHDQRRRAEPGHGRAL